MLYKTLDEDKEKVKCENGKEKGAQNPKKCSITFGDNAVRLDYSFVDKDEHTMVPTKIELYEPETKEKKKTGQWKLRSDIKYLNFTPIFSEEQIVNADLPIQKGCKRQDKESYPKIEADYGQKFVLEFDVLFNATLITYNFSRSLHEKIINHSVRTYSVKMFVDKANSISVAETIDETTNASIRTYYDLNSHLLHSVTLENNECHTYNLTSNRSLNWWYVQEMFIRRPEIFRANSNYSYLQDFNLDDVPTQVFEKKVYYGRPFSFGRLTNRKRTNFVSNFGRVLSSQYYPKDTGYWKDNPNGLSIPKRIELGIDTFHPFLYDAHLVIDIKSFKSNPKEEEKYDSSKCVDMDKNE